MNLPDRSEPGEVDPGARFRHDLLTPVNHILGYCSLLIDSARMRDAREQLIDLRSLFDEGRRVLDVIEDILPRDPAPDQRLDYALLAVRLAGPADAIVRSCNRLETIPSDHRDLDRGEYLDDLLQIKEASQRLIEMAHRGPSARA
ncbi:hypothetical protein TA3x_004581 [Tundrisphaera sp. TA3]|uniref:hypothetical protein n=1 Tax=Tundrisphaera sp. TA3 TaxID=3435775 RepID=UPI003EB9CDB3